MEFHLKIEGRSSDVIFLFMMRGVPLLHQNEVIFTFIFRYSSWSNIVASKRCSFWDVCIFMIDTWSYIATSKRCSFDVKVLIILLFMKFHCNIKIMFSSRRVYFDTKLCSIDVYIFFGTMSCSITSKWCYV